MLFLNASIEYMFKNKLDAEDLEYQRFLYSFEERPDVLHPTETEHKYELHFIHTVCSSSWNTRILIVSFTVLKFHWLSYAFLTRQLNYLSNDTVNRIKYIL
jgi:hypothetical protein